MNQFLKLAVRVAAFMAAESLACVAIDAISDKLREMQQAKMIKKEKENLAEVKQAFDEMQEYIDNYLEKLQGEQKSAVDWNLFENVYLENEEA